MKNKNVPNHQPEQHFEASFDDKGHIVFPIFVVYMILWAGKHCLKNHQRLTLQSPWLLTTYGEGLSNLIYEGHLKSRFIEGWWWWWWRWISEVQTHPSRGVQCRSIKTHKRWGTSKRSFSHVWWYLFVCNFPFLGSPKQAVRGWWWYDYMTQVDLPKIKFNTFWTQIMRVKQ